MEHDQLLQKMEILSRKISKLREDNRSVKHIHVNGNANTWYGHKKTHSPLESKTLKTRASKYQYTKSISHHPATNITLNSSNSLHSALLLPRTAKVHVNPHFKARDSKMTLPNAASQSKGLNLNIQNPLSDISVKKTVYINPTVFSSKNYILPSIPPGPIAINMQPPLSIPNSVPSTNTDSSTKHSSCVNQTLLSANLSANVNKNETVKTSVHVNPKVFARLKSEVKKERPVTRRTSITQVERGKVRENDSGNKSLISISRTKLVRSKSNVPRVRLLSATKVVPSPLLRIAKNVRSKYKYVRKPVVGSTLVTPKSRRITPFVKTMYKLDRRSHRTPKQAYKNTQKYKNVQKFSIRYNKMKRESFENNLQGMMHTRRFSLNNKSPFGNRVWGKVGSFQPKKVIITDRKLLRIGSSPVVKRDFIKGQSTTLVRIGGMLYKTSRTRLTRTSSASKPKSTSKQRTYNKTPISSRLRSRGGHIVVVRNDRFLMDPQGRTLRRVTGNSQPTRKRLDIGGATFLQTTPNVLIRTNRHNVQSLLSVAKQKSIARLAKMRKNNTICKFYRRFGKCFRNEKNRCPCVHDRKYVAICKGYLNGKCEKEVCLLSHDLVPEKMPTCKYFLQATCVRDSCPYLHIRLPSTAPLCIGYLQGYCADGIACRKWHFNICPQFDKCGSCPKGKYCPLPHKPRESLELNLDHMKLDMARIIKMFEQRNKKVEEKPKEEVMFRYFNVNLDKLDEKSSDEEVDTSSADEEESTDSDAQTAEGSVEDIALSNSIEQNVPTRAMRPTIGKLPSYISILRQ